MYKLTLVKIMKINKIDKSMQIARYFNYNILSFSDRKYI